MNIFGIGGWELVFILIIMLVVAGPKRMAVWAYTLGQWTAKLRVMWEEIAESIQSELKESGIDVEVPKTPPTRADIQRGLQKYGQQVMESAGNPQQELEQIRDEINQAGRTVKEELDEVDRTVKNTTKQNGPPPTAKPTTNSKDENSSDKNDFGAWGGEK